jgi:hypothetical protein
VNYNNYVKEISFDENGFSSTPSLSSRSGWLIFAVFFFLAAVKFTFVAFSGDESVIACVIVVVILLCICLLLLKTKEIKINSEEFIKHSYVGFVKCQIFSKHTHIPISEFESIDMIIDELKRAHKGNRYRNVAFYVTSATTNESIGVKIDLISQDVRGVAVAFAKDLAVLTGLQIKPDSIIFEEYF